MQNLYILVVSFLIASVAEGRSTDSPPLEIDLANVFTNVQKDATDAPEYEEECPFCPVCPTCPENDMECHIPVLIDTPCFCSLCLTRCYARNSVCGKGEACVLEDVNYGNVTLGQTAACKPFKQCRKVKCHNECPVSGFFVDVNGCKTCLCNDPCKELKCEGECFAFLTNVGTEPNYLCDVDF